jgi:uncharacterized protein YjbI with pentapeptide repeats
MDDVSFRMATMETTRFDHCDLARADFYEARLPGCQLLDCQLAGADFSGATVGGSELHGSRLDGISGAPALRGVRVDPLQAMALAHALLASHGIEVTDEATGR